MNRIFWLSFCDTDRPKGQQFLGVSVVDVTEEQIAEAATEVAKRFPSSTAANGPAISRGSQGRAPARL